MRERERAGSCCRTMLGAHCSVPDVRCAVRAEQAAWGSGQRTAGSGQRTAGSGHPATSTHAATPSSSSSPHSTPPGTNKKVKRTGIQTRTPRLREYVSTSRRYVQRPLVSSPRLIASFRIVRMQGLRAAASPSFLGTPCVRRTADGGRRERGTRTRLLGRGSAGVRCPVRPGQAASCNGHRTSREVNTRRDALVSASASPRYAVRHPEQTKRKRGRRASGST